jgi:microcystin degradation protein MlrC
MTKPFHIVVGGFQHETNTFAPNKTALSEFQKTMAGQR